MKNIIMSEFYSAKMNYENGSYNGHPYDELDAEDQNIYRDYCNKLLDDFLKIMNTTYDEMYAHIDALYAPVWHSETSMLFQKTFIQKIKKLIFDCNVLYACSANRSRIYMDSTNIFEPYIKWCFRPDSETEIIAFIYLKYNMKD